MRQSEKLRRSSERKIQMLLAASAAALAPAGGASADSREQLDISVGGSASSNPYLLPNDQGTDFAATLSVDPAIFMQDDVSTFTLQGHISLKQYTSRYGTDASASFNASGTTRLSGRTSLSSSFRIRSSKTAVQDVAFAEGGNVSVLPPESFPPVEVPDVTTAGRKGRVDAMDGSAVISHALSPVEQLQVGFDVGRTTAEGVGTHEIAASQISYRRQVSLRTSVSASASLGLVDYRDRPFGDARSIIPMIGIQHQFGEFTAATAQVGAAFTDIKNDLGGHDKDVGLALTFNLCDRRSRRDLCASASQQTRPTTYGGASTVSLLRLSYGIDVGEMNRLSIAGSYGRSESLVADSFLQDRRKFVALTSSYSHNLNDRLVAFVSPGFSRVSTSNGGGRRSDFKIGVGIRLRIGALS
ncbi:hypothetical protein GRI89_14315 [Altererythrobacter salegens]|uniref:Uncharacterized protein n=1 Tax=Croceibacterium salegens TaxID=1737568 RepID=A0A6I4SXZ5_9SPHN|nr:hypothetical protein [Croceibacterium salegens]MXO60713.1 hypothetical protein [Croceibacterium salegens]